MVMYQFLQSINNVPSCAERPVRLYATNYEVHLRNDEELHKMAGPLKVFQAQEDGPAKYLKRILTPRTLAINVGCPVMLLRNLNDQLVNGLTGEVQ